MGPLVSFGKKVHDSAFVFEDCKLLEFGEVYFRCDTTHPHNRSLKSLHNFSDSPPPPPPPFFSFFLETWQIVELSDLFVVFASWPEDGGARPVS